MKDRIGIFLGFKIQLPVIEGVAAIDDSSTMTLVDELGNGVCGVDGMTFTLRRLFRAFFFCNAAAKTVDPVTIESGAGISPFGDDGLDGLAEAEREMHFFGVLMPVVPSLL